MHCLQIHIRMAKITTSISFPFLTRTLNSNLSSYTDFLCFLFVLIFFYIFSYFLYFVLCWGRLTLGCHKLLSIYVHINRMMYLIDVNDYFSNHIIASMFPLLKYSVILAMQIRIKINQLNGKTFVKITDCNKNWRENKNFQQIKSKIISMKLLEF